LARYADAPPELHLSESGTQGPLLRASALGAPSREPGRAVSLAARAEAREEEGGRRHDAATCSLVLLNVAVFMLERFPVLSAGGQPFFAWRLHHDRRRFQLMQLITSMFCHHDYRHLSNNIFGMYIFGRAVEEQVGSKWFIMSYLICGVFANVVSLIRHRGHVVSLGASGAVFGLFVAATLVKMRPQFGSLVEFYVLGQFAWSQLQVELTGPYRPGVNSTVHVAGAVGGVIAYLFVRRRTRSK